MEISDLEKKAMQIRIEALKAIHKAGSGFMGSSMSVVEILTTLYYGELNGRSVMQFKADKPGWDGQDYLVLSKGQAAATLYTILADLEFFDMGELDFLRQVNSMLQGRPTMKVPGISASTSSHGQGLSIALGIALALKMDRKNNRVFCVMGDGELQEGQVWEAAMAAAHHHLKNLILFVDNNKMQEAGLVTGVMDVNPIQGKFEAFGWQVIQVRDGHDFDQILDALYRGFTSIAKPVCVWCHTVKGKRVDFAEGKPEYHGVALSGPQMSEIIPKLEDAWKKLS